MPQLGLDEVWDAPSNEAKDKSRSKRWDSNTLPSSIAVKSTRLARIVSEPRDAPTFEIKSKPKSLLSTVFEFEVSSADKHASKNAYELMCETADEIDAECMYVAEGLHVFTLGIKAVRLRVRAYSYVCEYEELIKAVCEIKATKSITFEITVKYTCWNQVVAPCMIAALSKETVMSAAEFKAKFGPMFKPRTVSLWKAMTSSVPAFMLPYRADYVVRAMHQAVYESVDQDTASDTYKFEVEYTFKHESKLTDESNIKQPDEFVADIVDMARIAAKFGCVPKSMNAWLIRSHVKALLAPKDMVMSKTTFTDSDKDAGKFVAKIDGMPVFLYRFPHVTYIEPAYKGKDTNIIGVLFEDGVLDMDEITFQRSFEVVYAEMFLGTYLFKIKRVSEAKIPYQSEPTTFTERKEMDVTEAASMIPHARKTKATVLPLYEYDGAITVTARCGTQIRYKSPSVDLHVDKGVVSAMTEDRTGARLVEVGVCMDKSVPTGVYEVWNPHLSSNKDAYSSPGRIVLTHAIRRPDKGKPNPKHVVEAEVEAMIESKSDDPSLPSRIGAGSWALRNAIKAKTSSVSVIVDVGGGKGRVWSNSENLAVIVIDPEFMATNKGWLEYKAGANQVANAMNKVKDALMRGSKIRCGFKANWQDVVPDLISSRHLPSDTLFTMLWSTTYCKDLFKILDEDGFKYVGVGMFYDKVLAKPESGPPILTGNVVFAKYGYEVKALSTTEGMYKIRDQAWTEPLTTTWMLPKDTFKRKAKDVVESVPLNTDEYFDNVFFVSSGLDFF